MNVSENTIALFKKKDKILVRGVARKLTANLDHEGVAFLVAVHSITPNKKCDPRLILGILNSKLFDWIHKDRFFLGRIPEGSLKYPVSFLKSLPLPPMITKKNEANLIRLVDRMLNNFHSSSITSMKESESPQILEEICTTDDEIDELVFEIYGFNFEERAVIIQSLLTFK